METGLNFGGVKLGVLIGLCVGGVKFGVNGELLLSCNAYSCGENPSGEDVTPFGRFIPIRGWP